MKFLAALLAAVLSVGVANAQKIDYKNNTISVDGTDLVKVNKIKDKDSFGLTSTFEVYSLSGKKLIIATIATEFKPNLNDNMVYYYRLTFLTTDQAAIFSLSKLGAEKSLVKLIGGSGIFVNDDVDPAKLREFIALKGKTPEVALDYTLVGRSRTWPIVLKEDKTIEQDKLIGKFKEVAPYDSGYDSYEISLPNGVVVARVSFKGGNNSDSFIVDLKKDNVANYMVKIPVRDKVILASTPVDRNEIALKRITVWLVSKFYL
jgi:hypothetical protein